MRGRIPTNLCHRSPYLRLWVAVLVCSIASACSDDGSGGQPDAGATIDGNRDIDAGSAGDAGAGADAGAGCVEIGARDAPLVTVLFPPRHSLTDATAIRVRGTASDATTITAIQIEGVTAATAETSDGFATWQIDMPLGAGDNALVVTSADDEGNRRCEAARIDVLSTAGIFVNPAGLAVDVANGRAFVVDDSFVGETVLSMDLHTGGRRLISGPGVGAGPAIHAAGGIALGPAGQSLFVGNYANRTVYAVDIASGDRSVLASPTVGSGPVIGMVGPIAVDGARARLVVADSAPLAEALIAIDIATGARTVLSDDATGAGVALGLIQALAIDAVNERAFVGNATSEIIEVDLSTGDRTLVVQGLATPEDIRFDEPNNRLLVLTAMDRALWAVDLATGGLSLISRVGTGAGIALQTPRGLGHDPSSGRAFVADGGLRMVVAVDLATGDRIPFSISTVGTGPSMASPTSVALHLDPIEPTLSRPIIWDTDRGSLLAIDLQTGAREVLVNTELSPPRLATVTSPTIIGDRFIGAHQYSDPFLVEFDLDALSHSVLASAAVGAGPYLLNVRSVDKDSASDSRMLLGWYSPDSDSDLSQGYLSWVDVATGNRTTVAGPQTGGRLHQPLSLVVDGNRALVFDQNGFGDGGRIVEVDLDTGAGTVIAGSGVPIQMWSGRDMLHDPAGTRLLTVLTPEDGSLAGMLMAMDLATMERTELSGGSVGRGPHLRIPFGMAMDTHGAYVYVTDALLSSVFAVDLVTGERVIIAR